MRTEVEARGGDQKYQDFCTESDNEAPCRVEITRDEKSEETVEHDIDRAMAAKEGKCTPAGVEKFAWASSMQRDFDDRVER